MKGDWITLLEEAYRLDLDDGAWLSNLSRRILPAMAPGKRPGIAFYFDASDPGARLSAWGYVGDRDYIEGASALHRQAPPFVVGALFRRTLFSTVRQSLRDAGFLTPDHYGEFASALGILDTIGLVCTDPDWRGCVFTRGLADGWQPSRRRGAPWLRVAAHVNAALRMRRKLREGSEAVLSPSGRIEHAEGDAAGAPARQALVEGAKQIDRARGKLRLRDPEEAVDIWRALVAGRWSLVDHFDTDGRRYLLARRNEPEAAGLRALTARERQVVAFAAMGHANKLIGYELGLSPSSVTMHLARAAKKVGARSRVELIEAYRRTSIPSPRSK